MPSKSNAFYPRIVRATALGLAISFAAASSAFSDVTLRFGAYTADKPTEVVKQFKPILDYIAQDMTARLGEPVTIRIVIAKNYQKGIENLATGVVDISRFGPASYVTAKQMEPDIGILAMETKKGKKTFKGIIAVREDSDISSVVDLKGRSFAFGDPLSTIGRYLAQDYLMKAGIKSVDLDGFEYLYRHDRVGTAVGQGSFDAGALKSSTFKKLVQKQVPIRSLAEFDNVTKPWLHRAGLDGSVVEALKAVFLAIDDPEVLESFSKSGFVAGSDQDFQIIRDAMARAEYFGG